MARNKISVDENMLRKIILDKENNNTYSARSVLYNDVALEYNQNKETKINGQLVYLRVKELNIPLKTPLGKRGKTTGLKPSGIRVSRATKLASDTSANETFRLLRQEMRTKYSDEKKAASARFLPLVNKMEQGSLKAAIKVMCLSCCNYEPTEVKACQVLSCPLHYIRPYKGKTNGN